MKCLANFSNNALIVALGAWIRPVLSAAAEHKQLPLSSGRQKITEQTFDVNSTMLNLLTGLKQYPHFHPSKRCEVVTLNKKKNEGL